MTITTNQRIAQFIIASITWVAVILQFYLQIVNRTTAVPEAVIRYFSYFTILTNLLVAVCFTSLLLKERKAERFFKQPSVLTAVTVYILIVGLVYNLVLRSQWNPQGLQLLADNLLHSITPLFTLLYWIVYVPAKEISWKQTPAWMLYPFFYLIYIMIRGSFSNFYPYFFIDVSKLGYTKAFTNAVYVTVAFFAVSLVLIWIGRKKKI
jgi:hypothetical protein